MQLDDKDMDKIDSFISSLEQDVLTIKHFTKFLNISEDKESKIKDGLKVLKSKIKSSRNAKSIDELKDILKVKSIVKKS